MPGIVREPEPEIAALLEKPLAPHLRVHLLRPKRSGGSLDEFRPEHVDDQAVGVLARNDLDFDRLARGERTRPQVENRGKRVENRGSNRIAFPSRHAVFFSQSKSICSSSTRLPSTVCFSKRSD